jgi:hypothetical protein
MQILDLTTCPRGPLGQPDWTNSLTFCNLFFHTHLFTKWVHKVMIQPYGLYQQIANEITYTYI